MTYSVTSISCHNIFGIKYFEVLFTCGASLKLGLDPSYKTYKKEMDNRHYVSMNQAPYGAQTLTYIGYTSYKTTFTDRFYFDREYDNKFIVVNDH